MNCSMPGSPVHHQLPELAQTHVHWVGDAIQLYHPLLSPSPPGFDLSQQSFFNELALHIRWSKYWSFSLGIRSLSPSNEYSGLILFKTDWFDPLAIQGTLKSFFQHHSSKASIHWHSAGIKPSHTRRKIAFRLRNTGTARKQLLAHGEAGRGQV